MKTTTLTRLSLHARHVYATMLNSGRPIIVEWYDAHEDGSAIQELLAAGLVRKVQAFVITDDREAL